ncbi:DsrE family protein [Sulfurovum sp.]|uniref:DsrE family protein n=1 Tax=Sulfurovum sp. TaxID=1969726 RepID=UPI0028681795|nr:DsrE family protein [Sulfurovum sp.]
MKLKNPLWMFIALMMASTLPALAKEKEKDDVVKIVYQCDFADAQRVHLMLNTLNNLVKHYQSTLTEYEINVVALGPCLQFVMKDFAGTGFEKKPYLDHGGPAGNGTTGRIKSLLMTAGDDMKIIGCENTMKEKNVKAEQIEDFVELVPAGIVKIIDLEREDYAYIKIM